MRFEFHFSLDTANEGDRDILLRALELEMARAMRYRQPTLASVVSPPTDTAPPLDRAPPVTDEMVLGRDTLREVVRLAQQDGPLAERQRAVSERLRCITPAEGQAVGRYVQLCGGLERAVSAVWSDSPAALAPPAFAEQETQAETMAVFLRGIAEGLIAIFPHLIGAFYAS